MSLGSTPSRCKPPIPAAPRAAAKLATSAAKVAGKRKQKERRKIDSSSYSSSSSADYETKSKRIIAKDARKQKALQARFKDNGAESDQILAKYPQLFSSLSSADATWALTSQQRLLDSSGSSTAAARHKTEPEKEKRPVQANLAKTPPPRPQAKTHPPRPQAVQKAKSDLQVQRAAWAQAAADGPRFRKQKQPKFRLNRKQPVQHFEPHFQAGGLEAAAENNCQLVEGKQEVRLDTRGQKRSQYRKKYVPRTSVDNAQRRGNRKTETQTRRPRKRTPQQRKEERQRAAHRHTMRFQEQFAAEQVQAIQDQQQIEPSAEAAGPSAEAAGYWDAICVNAEAKALTQTRQSEQALRLALTAKDNSVKQEIVEAVQEEKASHAKTRGDLQQALAVAKKAKESNESYVVASQARFDMLGTQLEEARCERDRTAQELEVQVAQSLSQYQKGQQDGLLVLMSFALLQCNMLALFANE